MKPQRSPLSNLPARSAQMCAAPLETIAEDFALAEFAVRHLAAGSISRAARTAIPVRAQA